MHARALCQAASRLPYGPMLGVLRASAVAGALAALALASAARADDAQPGASGRPFTGTDAHGAVRGWADVHMHITANQRAGGRVISGEPFDPAGIEQALGQDAGEHGADGSVDITGNLLRDGLPFGTHDTTAGLRSPAGRRTTP